MDEYTTLVTRVLKNDVLAQEVEKMKKECITKPNTINLISPDWAAHLSNDSSFQDCHFCPDNRSWSSPTYDYQNSKQPVFNVIMVGYCRFARPYQEKSKPVYAVVVNISRPLAKMARVVFRDLDKNVQLSDEFKFSLKTCSTWGCTNCSASFVHFKQNGIPVSKLHQPCIGDTKIFDGEHVVNRFHSQMVDMFPHHFIAMMHLKIDSRYSYQEKNNPKQRWHRISGIVTNMVAIHEAKLDLTRTVHLGDLTGLPSIKDVYPGTSTTPTTAETVAAKTTSREKKSKENVDSFGDLAFDPLGELEQDYEPESESLLANEEDDDLFAMSPEEVSVKKRLRNKRCDSFEEEDFFSIEKNTKPPAKKPRCEMEYTNIDDTLDDL